uniref:Reverse transcriptase zinc-binding domain-containing protein n=1 Tax=Davidia involucrata TaxID=16924 RepID=A0A5B7BYZ2_DAVIN
MVAWDAATTLDNFQKRGYSLVNRCYMCKEEEEMTSHLVLHCEVARELWILIFSMTRCWVMPGKAKCLLDCWNGSKVWKDFQIIWRMISLCLMWSICKGEK